MNPETYGWYQCDEEDYDSNASPEEQAEALTAKKQYAAQLIAGMREAMATVPSYCERYQPGCYSCGETNPAILVRCSQCKRLVCLKHQVGAPEASLCDECTEPLFRGENARFQRAMKIGGCHVE